MSPATLQPGSTRNESRIEKAAALTANCAIDKAKCPPPPSDEIDHQMKSARMAGIHSQVEKNKINSIGLQIAMLRSNEEVHVSVYGQEAYGRKFVGLLDKLPGLGTETTPLESELDSVGMSTPLGMSTPRANIT